MCFVSQILYNGWNDQALNAQKARVTSAPVRDSLVSMCMDFVVKNPQVPANFFSYRLKEGGLNYSYTREGQHGT